MSQKHIKLFEQFNTQEGEMGDFVGWNKDDLIKKISSLEQHIKQREELIIRNKEKYEKETEVDEKLIRMWKEKIDKLNFELTRTM